jgi:hypothetical protein
LVRHVRECHVWRLSRPNAVRNATMWCRRPFVSRPLRDVAGVDRPELYHGSRGAVLDFSAVCRYLPFVTCPFQKFASLRATTNLSTVAHPPDPPVCPGMSQSPTTGVAPAKTRQPRFGLGGSSTTPSNARTGRAGPCSGRHTLVNLRRHRQSLRSHLFRSQPVVDVCCSTLSTSKKTVSQLMDQPGSLQASATAACLSAQSSTTVASPICQAHTLPSTGALIRVSLMAKRHSVSDVGLTQSTLLRSTAVDGSQGQSSLVVALTSPRVAVDSKSRALSYSQQMGSTGRRLHRGRVTTTGATWMVNPAIY